MVGMNPMNSQSPPWVLCNTSFNCGLKMDICKVLSISQKFKYSNVQVCTISSDVQSPYKSYPKKLHVALFILRIDSAEKQVL